MEKNFCFDENQVERLVQLVKHSLVNLNVLMECPRLSDTCKLQLTDEYDFLHSILDVFLKRG